MKTILRISSVAAIFLAAVSARPCINEYSPPPFVQRLSKILSPRFKEPAPAPTKARPRPTFAPSIDPKALYVIKIVEKPFPADWVARERELRPVAAEENADFRSRNDYASTLLHLGRTREAVGILEALASQHPKEYSILATLGTAYELDGQLDRAVQYISKATELNPKSHMGTEWLHIKILEAKIAMQKNPTWLEANSVLGESFTTRKYAQEQARITEGVTYQLNERLQFVAPPDPIIADLLYDTARLYDSNFDYASAVPLYKASLRFGGTRKTEIESRLKPNATWQSQTKRTSSS
jgi:tetratricopeptide (TPR) repeat protein